MGPPNGETSTERRTVEIGTEDDVLEARTAAREAATDLDFRLTDVTRIVTATSELARNIHLHADGGTMQVRTIVDADRRGIELTFIDRGPGISDIEKAFAGELSPRDGRGRGLSGTEKLMDEMEIETEVDEGTNITVRKWVR